MNFIFRKFRWAKSNPLFWLNVLLVIATCFTLSQRRESDILIRSWSMFLQLLGAYTVWKDLSGAARDFGAAEILRRNWIWIKAGFGKPTPIELSGSAVSNSSSNGSLSTSVAFDVLATPSQRIAQLEIHVQRLYETTTQAFELIAKNEHDFDEKIKQTRVQFDNLIRATNERLKVAVVGGYPLLLFGAVWVAVGIIMSTYAPELAKWNGGPNPAHPPASHLLPRQLIKA
jgi:hypothetical protein